MTPDDQRARDALAFDPLPASQWITVHETAGIVVAVRYSEALSRLLRSLPCGRWDPDARHWVYPYRSADAIREALPEIERLAAAAQACADEETARREAEREAARAKRNEERKETERLRAAAKPRPLRPEFLTALNAPMHDLALESIGDDVAQTFRSYGFRPRAWVAQVMGMDGRGKWVRAFLSGCRDYSRANGVGSRGIMLHFHLQQGPIYEVAAPTSWRNTERYFLRIVDGQRIEMTAHEVEECLAK